MIHYIFAAPYLNIILVLIKEHLLLQKLSLRILVSNMFFMAEFIFLCYHRNLVIRLTNKIQVTLGRQEFSSFMEESVKCEGSTVTFLSAITNFDIDPLLWDTGALEVVFGCKL